MKCKRCNQDMKLRRFICREDSILQYERFIYECVNCGVLDYPKSNINHNNLFERRLKEALRDCLDFGILIEKEVLELLVKQYNYFHIIKLFSERGKKIITKEDFEKFNKETEKKC